MVLQEHTMVCNITGEYRVHTGEYSGNIGEKSGNTVHEKHR